MLNRQVIHFGFSKLNKIHKFVPKPAKKTEVEPYYPKQHPLKIDSKDSQILSIDKQPKYLNPPHEVPSAMFKPSSKAFESPIGARFLEVGIVGAPNAGKSLLFNKFINKNVSSVSNKSNTTQKDIRGIYTNIDKRTQILFHDTPGIIQAYKSSDHYVTQAWNVLMECDKVVMVVDSVKKLEDPLKEVIRRLRNQPYSEKNQRQKRKLRQMGASNENMSQLMEEVTSEEHHEYESNHIPTYLVMNKIDLCANKRKLKVLVNEIEDLGKFEKIFYTSADTGYGIKEIMEDLEEEAYLGPWEHHPDLSTDMSEVRKLEEIMKKVLYSRLYYEIPHQIGIRVTSFNIRSDGIVRVEYTLDALSRHQVGIVVGLGGRNLRLLKGLVTAELAKEYCKNFIVHIKVYENSSSFWHDPQIHALQGFYDKKYSLETAEKEVNQYKQNLKRVLLEEDEQEEADLLEGPEESKVPEINNKNNKKEDK